MTEPMNALVEGLFARRRIALQAFFFRRLRTNADAANLAQEVYLRILRVNDPDTIRNPEAYLFAQLSRFPGCTPRAALERMPRRRRVWGAHPPL